MTIAAASAVRRVRSALSLLLVGACGTGTAVDSDRSAVVVAVGDIACSASMEVTAEHCQHASVAELAAQQGAVAFLALGDLQYPAGQIEDFRAVFDRVFGPLPDVRPVMGNHEYHDPRGGGAGYFDYFNGEGVEEGPAGSRAQSYYSFDVGAWHVIGLNSECELVPGGCGPASPQRAWLLDDLEAHPARCTLVFWHRPRFAGGSKHVGEEELGILWNDLASARVDVLLAAHNHNAEVLHPVGVTDPDSLIPVKDPDGIQQFTVGTGGAGLYPFDGPPLMASDGTLATVARSDDTFGVLRLELREDAYDWVLLGVEGKAMVNADSRTTGAFRGTRTCR